jgi:hypothetical protein
MTQMTQMTQKECTALAHKTMAVYEAQLAQYQPVTTATLTAFQLTYSDHPVTVVCYNNFPREHIAVLQSQLAEAESRGYKSNSELLLFLHEFHAESDMAGGMVVLGTVQSNGAKAVGMGINTHKDMITNQRRALEHEYWHIIDHAGDHAGAGACATDHYYVPNTEADSDAAVNHMIAAMGNRSLSAGNIYRAVRDVQLENVKRYANQPSELFVHHRMCETAGLQPGSMEGYHYSHDIMNCVVVFLSLLAHKMGVPRSMCRKVAEQFSLEITQDRRAFMAEMRDSNYAWLFR